jgi:glycosyltransferase involved in cell wall biosynthesis
MISVLELRSVWGTGGGPEKTILLGAARHDRSRFAVTVCYLRDARDEVFGIDQRARRIGVDYTEVRERHSFDGAIWPQLVSLVRARRVDIIHGHDHKTDLLALLLARKTGAVALATAHGWTGQSVRERWLYYPADRQILRRMPQVIAVSTEIKSRLVRAGTDPTRVRVVLNGIDPEGFRRDPIKRVAIRRQMGFLSRQRVIGAVGRLEPQKRFDLLLDAFAHVHLRWPDTRLVIAGDGSQRDRLDAQARRLGISGVCEFLGHRPDIAGLHDAFDLFVQSSAYEGTPNAVLEAMAMETPIVATDVGGTGELAVPGVHGLIVRPGDATALAAAIGEVLTDEAAAVRRAAAARRRVESDLSFAERTRTLEWIYADLVARSRPHDHDAGADEIAGARSA